MDSYDVKVSLDGIGITRKWSVISSRHELFDKIRDQVTQDLRVHAKQDERAVSYQLYLREADQILAIDSSEALQKALQDLQQSSFNNSDEPRKLKFLAKKAGHDTNEGCIFVEGQKSTAKDQPRSSNLFPNSDQKGGHNAMMTVEDALELQIFKQTKALLDRKLEEISRKQYEERQPEVAPAGGNTARSVHNEVREEPRNNVTKQQQKVEEEAQPLMSDIVQSIGLVSDETSEPSTDEVSDNGTEEAADESMDDALPQAIAPTTPLLTAVPYNESANSTSQSVHPEDTPQINMAQTPNKTTADSGTINWQNLLVDPDAAREMLKPFVGSKNKITLISKALVRYEGLLRSVSSTSYQINLLSVRFLGSEDRPVMKKAYAKPQVFPSVSFQLNELRDVRVYLNGAQGPDTGALDETAPAPNVLSAPQVQIHTRLDSTPSYASDKSNKAESPAKADIEFRVQKEGVSGEFRLRVPDLNSLSPRKTGTSRSILLQIPSSMLSSQNSASQNQSNAEEAKPSIGPKPDSELVDDGTRNDGKRVTRSRVGKKPTSKSPIRKVAQPKSKSVAASRARKVSKEPETEGSNVSLIPTITPPKPTAHKATESRSAARSSLSAAGSAADSGRKRSASGRFSLKRVEPEVEAETEVEVEAAPESVKEPEEGNVISTQHTKCAKRARR
ncbi:hypothetical protein RvY_12744 [Ramazzottius varieornatus]|uniref:Lsm14-like N-terminal domain-containing protein n=1 Tax=Ramazzottius varieornatus TaxID=947166 RepID=A0A1D1VPN8_RAMVA|nr:hypothetical protein RvY_12744 [Ramazzottius varieornatus]